MNPISQDFAPPFKLIAPFFVIGGVFYLLASLFVFGFNVDHFSFQDPRVLAFVHLFLLGFVMMIIFGAMAQLVPVVLEVGHFGVELFYAIWPLLFTGTSLMIFGFLYSPQTLPYGGVVVLISMLIFVGEIFLTMFKVKEFNLVVTSVLLANIFLFVGIIFGLIIALTYAGVLDFNIISLLRGHVYLVVGGYIFVTVMGISVVLVPMFTLSHSFSTKPLKIAIALMSIGVTLVALSSLTEFVLFEYIGYTLSIISLGFYVYIIYIIYKIRPRKENDIYIKSLWFSYGILVVAILLGILYFITHRHELLLASGWLIFYGFVSFLITGHIYKIVPFLVWFERFSPLVGKQKVPMLADMVPLRSSEAQLVFSMIGVLMVTYAIIFSDGMFIKAGASFLMVGALAYLRSLMYMINFK